MSVLVSVLVVGCTASEPDVDANVDAVSIDAPHFADGGVLTANCEWTDGYGTSCLVPCNSAPDVVFAVRLHWYGYGYCCTIGGDGDSDDCVCQNGHAVCVGSPFDPSRLGLPTSRCELCPDVGPELDDDAALGASDDAGVDAR